MAKQHPEGCDETLGRLAARYRVVRALALATAGALARGDKPVTEAAVTKDLGTRLEQDTIEAVRLWRERPIRHRSGEREEDLLARAILTSPTFTLRGGTTEILRSLIGKSASVRHHRSPEDLLGRTVVDILSARTRRDGETDEPVWVALQQAGLHLVGIDEDRGGSGGTIRDAATVMLAVGACAAAVPLVDAWIAARMQVPYEPEAAPGQSLAGERNLPTGPDDLVAATRVLLIAGAARRVLELVAEHARTRVQFGKPINRFQAVGQQIAVLAEHVARAEMAAEFATRWLSSEFDDDDLAVATITAREAATEIARIAHQIHGAIGISEEHDLQLFTRRLWVWRDEGGSEMSWARHLGQRTAANAGHLWAWMSRELCPAEEW
jgi:alkylation response protein AidB-like acyl-CoA dehydrogenase